jgi:hypothetical protein
MVVLLRDIFECSHTPKVSKKWASIAKGGAKSLEDTAKGALVIASLPLLLTALGIKAAESLNKWEDKLGIKEKCITAKETIEVLFKEAKYDWENPEEYQVRQQAIKKYKVQMLAYDKAFNAERYHATQAEAVGYVTVEALQFVLGDEAVKMVDGALREGKVAALQRLEKVLDKANIEGGKRLVGLPPFKKEASGKAIIDGSKGMVRKEFVYNIDYIVWVEKGIKVDMLTVFAEVSRQAKEAGATSVRLNFNYIINDKLRKLFRTAKNEYGGKMMGWKVEGVTVWGGDVTLTKNL